MGSLWSTNQLDATQSQQVLFVVSQPVEAIFGDKRWPVGILSPPLFRDFIYITFMYINEISTVLRFLITACTSLHQVLSIYCVFLFSVVIEFLSI